MFRKLKGQEQSIGLLQKAIENNKIAQAYLFYGNDGVGKFISALYFGMALNCGAINQLKPCGVCPSCHKFLCLEHPDLHYVFPTPNLNLSLDGEIKNADALKQYQAYLQNKIKTPWLDFFFKESTEIRKESITYLIKKLELSAHEARYRIVIIENAEMMNVATANSFLKTLEEPPENTVVILITERPQKMLSTIISRTQQVYFKPLARNVIKDILCSQFEIEETKARTAARIGGGNLKNAIRIASENDSVMRNWAFDLIDAAARKDDLGLFGLLDKYKELQKKDTVGDLLKYIRIIVGDLNILNIDDRAEITSIDRLDYLNSLLQNENSLDEKVLDYLLFLEDLNRKVEGNGNLFLIMINLYLQTKYLLSA